MKKLCRYRRTVLTRSEEPLHMPPCLPVKVASIATSSSTTILQGSCMLQASKRAVREVLCLLTVRTTSQLKVRKPPVN